MREALDAIRAPIGRVNDEYTRAEPVRRWRRASVGAESTNAPRETRRVDRRQRARTGSEHDPTRRHRPRRSSAARGPPRIGAQLCDSLVVGPIFVATLPWLGLGEPLSGRRGSCRATNVREQSAPERGVIRASASCGRGHHSCRASRTRDALENGDSGCYLMERKRSDEGSPL